MLKAFTLKGALRIEVFVAAVDVLLFIKSNAIPFYHGQNQIFCHKGIYTITSQK